MNDVNGKFSKYFNNYTIYSVPAIYANSSTQATLPVNPNNVANCIPFYKEEGTPGGGAKLSTGTPTVNTDAANKYYVDKKVSDAAAAQQLIDEEQDKKIAAVAGLGGALTAYDFQKATPNQQDLTDYALSQIPNISDPTEIFNGTHVTNLFNGVVWQLTNTPDTDPPIFEWTEIGAVSGSNNTSELPLTDPNAESLNPTDSNQKQANEANKTDHGTIWQHVNNIESVELPAKQDVLTLPLPTNQGGTGATSRSDVPTNVSLEGYKLAASENSDETGAIKNNIIVKHTIASETGSIPSSKALYDGLVTRLPTTATAADSAKLGGKLPSEFYSANNPPPASILPTIRFYTEAVQPYPTGYFDLSKIQPLGTKVGDWILSWDGYINEVTSFIEQPTVTLVVAKYLAKIPNNIGASSNNYFTLKGSNGQDLRFGLNPGYIELWSILNAAYSKSLFRLNSLDLYVDGFIKSLGNINVLRNSSNPNANFIINDYPSGIDYPVYSALNPQPTAFGQKIFEGLITPENLFYLYGGSGASTVINGAKRILVCVIPGGNAAAISLQYSDDGITFSESMSANVMLLTFTDNFVSNPDRYSVTIKSLSSDVTTKTFTKYLAQYPNLALRVYTPAPSCNIEIWKY